MTLSLLPPVSPTATPPLDAEPDWAVVEILRDGSFGRAELVRALEPVAAARLVREASALRRTVLSPDELTARLGLALAGSGRLAEAGRAFQRVVDLSGAAAELDCAGHLSLVEACRGDLRRASARAEEVLALGNDLGAGVTSALLATAWIHAERDEHAEAARHLALATDSDAPPDAWTGAVRTLLEARLLLATRPDSAVQLLAQAGEESRRTPAQQRGWTAAAVEVARAEALLVLGEPHRALNVLTPVPAEAAVEASVTVAVACLEIGDLRGAEAVLSAVRDPLETASLSTQLRAWLLEARIADERGRPERAVHLVERALRAASCEDLRSPLRREWRWLRVQVERDHSLARTYRDFLRCLGDDALAHRVPIGHRHPGALHPGEALGPHLTRRETEVLDLLARMYSTDEIAEALFVSANTVKTHLKGLYAKLCVSRRADAVRRGRQLGLC